MSSIPENLRLKELVIITNLNKPFFEDFTNFLRMQGYTELYDFVGERNSIKAKTIIKQYLDKDHKPPNHLYDGIARPYAQDNAKWLLLV